MDVYSDSLQVRPINENGLAEVLEVYRESEDFLALGPEPKASMAMVIRDLETSRQEEGAFCGIYTPDGRLVGVIDFVPGGFDGEPHLAFVSLLIIIASMRNRGIGTKVLELVESQMRAASRIREIRTAVQVNNPAAIRFWKRNKYQVFGSPQRRPDGTIVWYLRKDMSVST